MPAGGLRACLMLSPSLGLFVALFIVPFAYFFVVSFWQFRSYRLVRDPTVANYAEVLRDYVPLMVFTLGMSILIAACALSAGFVYAYIIRFQSGRFGPLLLFAALITLFGGYLMKIYAWRTILGTEGIVNSLLLDLGIVAEPLTWLLYNPPAVVLTLTNFLFPFAMLPVVASLRAIRDIEIEAARDLGATPWRIFLDHILPRCRTGIIAGFALPFLIACGDWVTPVLVGGRMTMLGNLIAAQFGDFVNWPLGAAMSFTLLAAAMVVIAGFAMLTRLADPR